MDRIHFDMDIEKTCGLQALLVCFMCTLMRPLRSNLFSYLPIKKNREDT